MNSSQLASWVAALTSEERAIYDVAMNVHKKIVLSFGMTGACYRLTFFMTAYLFERHGISISPVVGYINDGTGEVMSSHAWSEYRGKPTDISLTLTEHPDIQPTGALLILGKELQRGHARYTYHRERSLAGQSIIDKLLKEPRLADVISRKEEEHRAMQEIANSPRLMRSYLDGAPDGLIFNVLSRLVKTAGRN